MTSLFYFLISSFLSALAIMAAVALARERADYLKSFVAAIVATFASAFLLSYVPINQLFLEVLLWIALIKVLFRFSWKSALVVGILGYAIKYALDLLGIMSIITLLT